MATVTGVWSGEQLQVERQTRPKPWPWPVAVPRWATPPCPPPPGGWPIVVQRGDVRLEYDLGDLRDTGAAVAVTIFRPGRNQVVLVVAARLTRMLPEIAAWAVPLPSGILTLEPWLTPLRARQTTTSRQTHLAPLEPTVLQGVGKNGTGLPLSCGATSVPPSQAA